MVFSIICVYSNYESLENNLLKGLKKQNYPYELILIDNRNNKSFSSAASALNWGARKAKGEYLIFCHQDIVLAGKDWFKRARKILSNLNNLGIAGVAGRNDQNKRVGYIDDGWGKLWGEPFSKPQPAQTLDECLIIIPKIVFKKLKFDERNFDHWHCYAVDYALSTAEKGLKTYVLPLFIKHNTAKTNMVDLLKYQRRVFDKHKRKHRYICTTCGFLSSQSLAIKEIFPNNKLADIYWTTAGDSPRGKIFSSLARRGGRAFIKLIKK